MYDCSGVFTGFAHYIFASTMNSNHESNLMLFYLLSAAYIAFSCFYSSMEKGKSLIKLTRDLTVLLLSLSVEVTLK